MYRYQLNVAPGGGQGWRFATLLLLSLLLGCSLKGQVAQPFPQRLPSRATTVLPDNNPPNSDCDDAANSNLPECASSPGFSPGVDRLGRNPDNPVRSRALRGVPTGLDDQTSPESRIRIPGPQYQEPEPPTEFQRYVKASTGRMLPIFGASLFDGVPSTFAPVDRIPVNPAHAVGPGDELEVKVWGQINFSQRLVVDREGAIYLPEVGAVNLAGLTFSQVQPVLKSAIGRVYRNFDLSVNLGQLRTVQIFMVGQARRPGSYTVSSLSTLLNALFATGGPSSRGSLRHIQLKRGDKVISELDLYSLLLDGDTSKDVPIQPGDIVFIPPVGPQIAMSGSVSYPAIYELKDTSNDADSALGQLVAFSGGLSPLAALQQAVIERVQAGSSLNTVDVTLDAPGLATKLRNGDIVKIQDVVERFDNAVTLRGNVAVPRRVPWRDGMTIRDLIPNKESLLTRDYWKERNELVVSRSIDATRNPATGESGSQFDNVNSRPDASGKAFTQVAVQNARGDQSLASAQSNSTGLTVRKFDIRNQVQQAAPDIDWDYAVVERLEPSTLATRLIPFNLGEVVLKGNPDRDVALKPGDVVTIFSKADIAVPLERRTKFVRVEGEVEHAGVYSLEPGETLRALVKQAGGITPGAYLYGIQFTRESTQREQQQRFSSFLDSLEVQINQTAANQAGRVLGADQAAITQTTLTSQRALVQKLRETPPTGRIVLDLDYKSSNVDVLPEMPLEDGDRIYIPNRPSTVNVIGNVNNQASFVYSQDLRLGDYLQQAGGPSRFADRSHMFVIRADGSVLAKPEGGSLFSRNIESQKLLPGDTLVVPTFVNKVTFLRGLTDWSQVIANFALGAAAVNVLK
jgi:polysaccharide export outer membrane protein